MYIAAASLRGRRRRALRQNGRSESARSLDKLGGCRERKGLHDQIVGARISTRFDS